MGGPFRAVLSWGKKALASHWVQATLGGGQAFAKVPVFR